jgi:hypothetical protein
MVGKNYGAGSTTGGIILTSPTGVQYTSIIAGNIANITEETNGPDRTGVTNGYTPFTYLVGAGEAGIWEVQFTAMGKGTTLPYSPASTSPKPQDAWTQPVDNGSSALIAAWDISVGNATTGVLASGRAYTTLMALCAPNGIFLSPSFYGKVYVLTPSGFAYEVDGNGFNGASWNFFSNNKGSKLADGSPSYQSYSYSSVAPGPANMIANFHDPRTPDNGTIDFTNKIFYNKPNADLPVSAKAYFSNVSQAPTTWLKPVASTPDFNITGLSANCGGQFKFTPTSNGTYRIALDVGNNTSFDDDVDVLLTGQAVGGQINTVQWDGKNGLDSTVSFGTVVKAKISISLPTSEVHFPFIDVETNQYGIKIQSLSSDYSSYVGNTVYWNDAELTGGIAPSPLINKSAGANSTTNGHIWYGTTDGPDDNSYGNNKMLDTWAFLGGSVQNLGDITLCRIISGNVWPDRDQLTDGKIDNEYTNNGETKIDGYDKLPSGLKAVLVNKATGKVIQVVPVDGGTYVFSNIADNASGYTWTQVGSGFGNTSSGTNGTITIPPVTSSTNSITDANFAIYSATTLPISFGSFSAEIVNGQLLVNWSTITETNNSYFDIEVSKDGKNFTSMGKVDSKATNGNSTVALNYEFSATGTAAAVLGSSLMALALAGFGFKRKNKTLYALALVCGLSVLGAASCTKNDLSKTDDSSKLFVRIKQVDKDGSISYSKVIQAVKK